MLATLLLVLGGAYFGLLFVGMGWLYPRMVAEVAPQIAPLRLLNEYLLHGLLGLTVGRFFLQRSAGSALRPYLSLPIRRGRLVRLLQAASALSLFNLLPLLTLAALWGSTVWPSASTTGAAFWAGGAVLAVALTQFANSFLRAVWDRNARLVLGGAALLLGTVAGLHVFGMGSMRAVSAWLFGGLSAGRLLPLGLLCAVVVGLAAAAHRALRARRYGVLDRGPAPSSSSASGTRLLGQEWSSNRAVSFAFLDAKLILRNRRPRQMLGVNLSVWLIFGLILVEGDISPFNQVLFGFILSGHLGLGYCQYGYAWHGTHFDGMLVRAFSPTALVRGHYLTFAVLAAAPVGIMLPFVIWIRPGLLSPIGAFFLFNLGVSAPFLIGMGVWFRDALHLNESAFFNYQGTSSLHFLSVVLLMGLPMGLVIGLGKPMAVLVGAGLGALGITTTPFWTRGLGRLLRWRRHAMAVGFRDTE